STGDGIMRWTNDGGTTWTDDIIVAPAPLNWLMGLDFADSLHGLAVGSILSSGDVFITTNGGINADDWTSIVADPTQGWFAGNFTMRTDGKYYITGISFCNSSDYGLTWSRRSSIDNVFDGGVSFPDDMHGWTGGGSISPTVEGWAHRTTDGGNTWSNRILSTPYPVRVIYFFDSQNGIAQGGEVNSGVGGIWESTDGGINWTEAQTTGLEMGSLDWQPFSSDSIYVWSVGYTSSGGFHSVVYRKSFGYTVIPVELTSFAATTLNSSVVLSWQTATETNNRGFDVERQIHSQPAVGRWEKIGFVEGAGITSEPRSYSFKDDNVSKGIYSYRLKQIDFDGSYKYSNIVEVEINTLSEFALSQNYPNPFNPATQINYNIPEDGYVILKVYNSLGQEVANLVHGIVKAGSHSVTFDGKNLSSGIYYYRIEAGNNVSVKKMILMK
ncbi:MAG TPA: T9SS type A sorting domain-containing protein, partial [Ignavibacteriaceae bacterium]|nr:T9SS type A sorting domain-containing protein [Ignavibacteriaceae bacterium]